MDIKIFENKEKKIDLPILIDSRMICMANSGAGKSYLVRKILEESHEKVMSIILDFEGEFKTLREKYDYLLIGHEGDVKLNMKAAHLLPKKILELNVPTIIDISDLKRNERITYIKRFLEALMDVPRELWKPCLVVLDEIHQLAGQQEKQDSTHAVIDLATRGRKRGFCLIGVTQRISKLHKDVVAELNNYMVGRTSLDIDMKRSADILGFNNKQDMLSLRELDDGEFFCFGPAISRTIEKEKVALSKTTHPKQGMDIKQRIIPPTAKVRELISKLDDLPKEQEKELKELKDYREEITRLKRELNTKPKEQIVREVIKADAKAIEKSREIGFKDAERQYLSHIKSTEFHTGKLKKELSRLMNGISSLLESKTFSILSDTPRAVFEPKMGIPSHILALRKLPIREKIYTGINKEFSKCARTIYSLLFTNPDRGFTKTQIGLLTGYSPNSGGFSNAFGELNSGSLIRKEGNRIFVGEIDSSIASEEKMQFTKENLLNKLGRCPKEIIDVLIENPNEELSKEEIAERTPSRYSAGSGGFSNSLGKLNTLNMIIRVGTKIKINPEVLEYE